jgi:hypothetical protein
MPSNMCTLQHVPRVHYTTCTRLPSTFPWFYLTRLHQTPAIHVTAYSTLVKSYYIWPPFITLRSHLIGSTYQWPCIDRPCIDMPRLGSTSRGHISICHVFHCNVTHITIRDGTIAPLIPLPCHPHPQYVMVPSHHVFYCYHSLHRARKTSC